MEPPSCKNPTWTPSGTPVGPVGTGLPALRVKGPSTLGLYMPVLEAPDVIVQPGMPPPIRPPNSNSPLAKLLTTPGFPATRAGLSKEPLETIIRLLQAGAANKRVPSTIPTFNLNMQILRRAT